MSDTVLAQGSRPYDYQYDPLFTVSGSKDYYKAAMMAKISGAKFQICPIFANMFSDLPNYPPRELIIRRRTAPVPSYRMYRSVLINKNDQLGSKKVDDIVGADRAKYFHRPLNDSASRKSVPGLELEKARRKSALSYAESEKKKSKNTKNKSMQTQFRESSAQTSPWEPPYKIMDEGVPELLLLDFLEWGKGLPAGVHEIELIERMRMKREWMQKMENMNADQRRDIVEAIERNEWAFREQEIHDIQCLRLELLKRMLDELHDKSQHRNEQLLENVTRTKKELLDKKLQTLRHNTERELRKLSMKDTGINRKYHHVDVITEHLNAGSDMYAQQTKFGDNPRYWHQVVDEKLRWYSPKFKGVEKLDTLPKWLEGATKIKDCVCLKLPGTRLCMRETKWTTPVLRHLHEELKNLRKETRRYGTSLIQRIETPPSTASTEEVEAIPDEEEDFYQAIITMQSVIKGRASQTLIYEGRVRCRELINQLKLTCGLLEEQKAKIQDDKVRNMSIQREQKISQEKMEILQENLKYLQGMIAGTLLDFLNKELRRLHEERRAHAMCVHLERERNDREAAEAGRRQVELRRRREHDEMFKQIAKIHQETVDLYLEDIIKEGMEFASEMEANDYIAKMAKKIDEEALKATEKSKVQVDENEELVADLVHHFVLPEVRKETVRKKVLARQRYNLQTVHETIYNRIDEVEEQEGEGADIDLKIEAQRKEAQKKLEQKREKHLSR